MSQSSFPNTTPNTMLKCYLDLGRLKQIAEITKPARTEKGWKKDAWRMKYEKYRVEAIKEYEKFVKDLVAKYVPGYDDSKHQVNITAIYVSEEADKIIQQILYGADYLNVGLAHNDELGLKGNECIILLDRVLVDRGGGADDRQGGRGNDRTEDTK